MVTKRRAIDRRRIVWSSEMDATLIELRAAGTSVALGGMMGCPS